MAVIDKIELQDLSQTVELGADALNVEIKRDENADIIDNESGVVASTEPLATTLKTHESHIDGKAPKKHASSSTAYGVATTKNYGHVRVSTANDGLKITSGTLELNANSQLISGAREPLPHASSSSTYPYGFASTANYGHVKIGNGLNVNNGAVSLASHASTATTYGIATTANYGHVKIGEGLNINNGTVSLANHASTATTYGVATTKNYGHVKFGTTAGTACQGNDSRLSDSRTPVSHASTATMYGVATTANYGHVKFGTEAGTACQGNDSRLSDSRTPKSHATNATTYGVATTKNYGHVKISEGLNVNNGTVSLANHANTSTVYGMATDTKYGHVKISDSYSISARPTGLGIAAGIGAVDSLANDLRIQLTAGSLDPWGLEPSYKFYFDYQDGKFGFNTSSSRGADTFHPFSGGDFYDIIYSGDVLWTNPKPSNAFAGQTITISDCSSYTYIVIMIKNTKSVKGEVPIISLVEDLFVPKGYIGYGAKAAKGGRSFECVLTNNVPDFTKLKVSAYSYATYDESAGRYNVSQNNGNAIPVKIIGIK